DDLVRPGARRHGRGERVEVDHDELERRDAELVELREVVRLARVREDPGVHARVQRLDAALEALGEPGEVLDLGHGDTRARDGGGGRAGGDELDARGVERRRELDEAGLVVDAEERAAHGPLRVVGELDVGGGGRGMGHDEGLLWVAVAATDLTVASGRTQAPRRSTHQQVDPAAPRWSFPPSPVAAAAQSSGPAPTTRARPARRPPWLPAPRPTRRGRRRRRPRW